MVKIYHILCLLLLGNLFCWKGNATVEDGLVSLGMENVKVVAQADGVCIAYEDNVYRGTYRGLFDVIRTLLNDPDVEGDIRLVVLEDRIPQITVSLGREALVAYRQEEVSLAAVMKGLAISYDTDEVMKILKGAKAVNRSAGKVDLVLYPQVKLQNSWLDKIYGTVLNIAPAVEVGLWKGASFTGQVIFPVWNNLVGEMDYIRAGMLVLRQEIRLPKNIFAALSVGNFNQNRIGVDLDLLYRTNSDRWAFGLTGGLTGSSTFYGGKWEVTQWKRVSGTALIRYNEPYYNLQFDLSVHRYIYGDYGVRGDCSRHFGEVTVGLFAMYSGGEANGGFHVAIPLPRKKRSKHKAVRVRLPEYFDWQYEAQSGPWYTPRKLGRSYKTRPDENRSRGYYNPDFIKDNLVGLAERFK